MGKKGNTKTKPVDSSDDERFAAALTRPQFRVKAHEKDTKVVLDERFSSVLTDPRFQLQEKDKYGRKKKNRKQAKDELSEFYTVVDGKEQVLPEKGRKAQKHEDDSSTSTDSSSSENLAGEKEKTRGESTPDDDENANPASRISYLTALSRGEIDVSSSSEEEDDAEESSSDDESSIEGEDPVYGTAGILDPSAKEEEEDVEITYEDSPYLAVTNLDWTHVRAVDVFVLLSSFTPPGAVKRVQVFPSDFGMEKMEHELKHGPPSLWKKKSKRDQGSDDGDDDNDDEEAEEEQVAEKERSELKSDEAEKLEAEGDNNSHESDGLEDGFEADDVLPPIDDDDIMERYAELIRTANEQPANSDFDPEKLRAYEASKLKYYFAVAELSSAEYADIAYKEIDGMEFEHSSAAADLRSIPRGEIDSVVRNRKARDEATSIPSTYVPPEFVVSALQQTKVQCTWEAGDAERERALTKYTSADQWAAAAEADDLKAYLASDNSADEESEDEKNEKGAKLRKLLGLDSDDENDEEGSDKEHGSLDDEEEKDVPKEFTYIPGAKDLGEKIRSKLQSKNEEEDLTPWEKYQQKRKEKRRERRQAARRKRSDVVIDSDNDVEKAQETKAAGDGDDFFLNSDNGDSHSRNRNNGKMTEKEIELLMAGDNDEEVARDFDMRGIQRIEKNRGKMLRGSRKRKEDKIAAGVSGQGFAINLKDDRFSAVLDGDDGRFGIDRTDPQYKETSGMRRILEEQKARRKKKRKKNSNSQTKPVPPDVVEGSNEESAGSTALSSLVKSLKTKVSHASQ